MPGTRARHNIKATIRLLLIRTLSISQRQDLAQAIVGLFGTFGKIFFSRPRQLSCPVSLIPICPTRGIQVTERRQAGPSIAGKDDVVQEAESNVTCRGL
jgi:hypothetical protein